MGQAFQNNSCNPFLAPSGTCELGNLAQYAINVADPSNVVAGIQFAQAKNIRLIVKNTGHDFLGRSSGAGSLALWTHNLKTVSFLSNYKGRHYSGPAMRLGAGVQAQEAYAAASAHGYRVVGGSCPTIGIVGGWLPGGGHGPLQSAYGLGADNALEYEVVTIKGRHTTASPTQNADLYWALSGGGGGTYAIVLSVTMRAHRDGPVAGTEWAFLNTNPTTYWAAVEAWAKHLQAIQQNFPTLNTAAAFNQESFFASTTLPDAINPNKLHEALSPFSQKLASLNITLVSNRTILSPSFNEHFKASSAGGSNNNAIGSRLIPRALVQDHKRLSGLIKKVRTIATSNSALMFGFFAANVSTARVGIDASLNSVLPAWRDSAFHLGFVVDQAFTASWAEMQTNQATINGYMDEFRAMTPGGGSYANEASYNYVHWKTDYYGANYERLLAIKRKYDPGNVLWGGVNVGGDLMTVAGDGRLCRATEKI